MTKPKPHPRDVGYSNAPFIQPGDRAVPVGLGVCRTCGKTVIDDEEAARLRQDSKP